MWKAFKRCGMFLQASQHQAHLAGVRKLGHASSRLSNVQHIWQMPSTVPPAVQQVEQALKKLKRSSTQHAGETF